MTRSRIALHMAVWILTAPLVGCAPFGLVEPKSATDRLAYANGMATGLMKGSTSALNARQIGSADARFVASVADRAAELLDAAEVAIAAGDLATAEGQLALAQSVLDSLDAYLKGKAGETK